MIASLPEIKDFALEKVLVGDFIEIKRLQVFHIQIKAFPAVAPRCKAPGVRIGRKEIGLVP